MLLGSSLVVRRPGSSAFSLACECDRLPCVVKPVPQEEPDLAARPQNLVAVPRALCHGPPQSSVQGNAWKTTGVMTTWQTCQPGQAVRLANLQQQPQFNGQMATVVRQDPVKGKFIVRLTKDAREARTC